ncbi:MAG: 50S ribosomal protein L4 [Magnetococcales bacterium]|nr:50S ribosomal protein L4 [Magnetococcales bacterium]PPR19703.1 MAG: 50S ribosomal protein L4 [Pseudomonadota bacterium]
MKLDVITLDGKKDGSVELSKDIFGLEVRKDLLQRAVLWQQARWRAGTASTLGRSDVSFSKKKVVRQKGSGGARHGAKSSNIFRKGGVVFGPTPRSFAFDMPKKVRALALKTALSAKVASGDVVVLKDATAKTHKTKDMAAALTKLDLTSALFVVDSVDENFDKATRNIPHVNVVPTEGVNVFNILKAKKLVMTQNAISMVEASLNRRSGKEA